MTNGCISPLRYILHLHIRNDNAGFCVTRLWLLTEMHIEISLGPRLLIVLLTTPWRSFVITIEVVVLVWHSLVFKLQIDGEAANGLGNGVDAIAECRTYQLRVRQFQRPHGVGVRDDIVARYICTSIYFHSCCMRVVTYYLSDLIVRQHPAAILFYGTYHGRCNSVAPSHNSKGTLIIKVHDESMGRKRCLVFLGSIEWQGAHKDFSQQRIGDNAIDYFVDRSQLVFGVDGGIALGMFQRMQRRCPSHAFYQVEIGLQLLTLMGEIADHLLDEGLATICKAILLPVKTYDIISILVERCQHDIFLDLQILQQTVQRLSLSSTSDEMHARLKTCSATRETLQAATHLSTLLQNGHLVTVLCQDDSTRQASHATAYDDYSLFTHLALFGSLFVHTFRCNACATGTPAF